jgi:hypothetical protein
LFFYMAFLIDFCCFFCEIPITNTTSISHAIDTNSTSVKESTIISTCSITNKNEELSTFEKSTKSCEAKLKRKDAGNYSSNADNTEANMCSQVKLDLLLWSFMCRSKAFACAKCFPQNLQFFNETSKLSSVEFDFPFGFPTRTNLNIHSVVHNSINQYICEYCGKGYRDPRQLKVSFHINTSVRVRVYLIQWERFCNILLLVRSWSRFIRIPL